ncbi:hypothetical protein Brsp01_45920 [Brucella sp. NBRC 12950]|nr:hypothetical protein Brsp01_45920 [Brucella sp. NBRC 12950]
MEIGDSLWLYRAVLPKVLKTEFGAAMEQPPSDTNNSRSGKGPTAYVYPH